jgi:glucosamine-phosphate N-acetyltransferase
MREDDLQKGFFETLSNLSEVEGISNDLQRAKRVFLEIKTNPLYKIFVAVKDNGEVIGLTTLLVEQKFIHDGGKVGHIEDVVTKKEYEGMGVGTALINASLNFAKEKNCYKVILDCLDNNILFYEKLGFKRHLTCMRYNIK